MSSVPIHRVTLTVGGRKHLLTNESCIRIALDSLAWLCNTGRLVQYGFVLLPSQVGLLGHPVRDGMQTLAESFATFTSGRMTAALRRTNRGPLMQYLHERNPGTAPGAPIWGGIEVRPISGKADALRCLEAMHAKPVSAEWGLAASPSEYLYSSACYYREGLPAVLPLTDIRQIPD
jgi:hypothetical protein